MADHGEPAVVIERQGSGVGTFLFGIAVGAGLALLFAPQSGEDTRAEVRRTARRVRRKARDLAETGRDAAQDLARTGRDAAKDLARTGKSAARDARAKLEERLARHRDRDEQDDGEGDGV